MWPVITNGFGICYMLKVCVLSRDLSSVVEIWIILSGMFRTLDKKSIKKKYIYIYIYTFPPMIQLVDNHLRILHRDFQSIHSTSSMYSFDAYDCTTVK